MTITRADVADLREGDVVEFGYDEFPDTVTRGPLRLSSDGRLWVARTAVREANGNVTWNGYLRLLTVISRAPRLYVNHPRTEPVPGDVVRDADSEFPDDQRTWMVDATHGQWFCGFMGEHYLASQLPTRLRLLVDGETGLPPAVQS